MKWVFAGLILLSVVFGAGSGRMGEVSAAAIRSCSDAVTLTLQLAGSICLWSGLMKVAERAGVTRWICRLLRPVTRLLFREVPKDSPALSAISMNITANLLGLGNAATPLGIAAVKLLAAERPPQLRQDASVPMITFVVLNTASIQLLPTTIALLRLENGAADPLDVLPAILVCSVCSLAAGLVLVRLCAWASRRREACR